MASSLNAGHFAKLAPDASVWGWQLKTAEQKKLAQRKLVADVAKATAFFFREACNAYSAGFTKTADILDGDQYRQMPVVHSPDKNRRDRSIQPQVGSNGKREIGYSAQAFAAEQLYHAVEELDRSLDLQISPGSANAAYEKVHSTLTQIATEFDSSLRNSKVGMLDKAAKHLLQTMPPLQDNENLKLWTKTVKEQTKSQVLKMMQQNTVADQANTLRGFWDKSKDKAFGWMKTKLRGKKPAPAVAPPAPVTVPEEIAAASYGRIEKQSESVWTWKIA